MSKLSETLKALISAPHARPGYTKAPANLRQTLTRLARDAQSHNVGMPAFLTIGTATSMTLNCPDALTELFKLGEELATSSSPSPPPPSTSSPSSISSSPSTTSILTAELIRETALKCISFNGIPRTINCLGTFTGSLPPPIRSRLSTNPTRQFTPTNIPRRLSTGRQLWDSVYRGVSDKLVDRLATSHPDLPVHILHAHYAGSLSDPDETRVPGAKVGRVLTSLVAIACLRAQTGVGPQVTSHVFGLRKAYQEDADGRRDADAPGEEPVVGGEWLAGDEGSVWVLGVVDAIVEAVTAGAGTTFAPGLRAKL